MDSSTALPPQTQSGWHKLWRWAIWIRPAYEDAFSGDSLPPGPQFAAGMLLVLPVGTTLALTSSMALRPDVLPVWYGVPIILAVYALCGLGYYWLLRSHIGGYADSPAETKKKWTKMEVASQVMLFLGAFSVLLLGNNNPWGFVVGIVQQPFWYYTSVYNQQWGLLCASLVYTVAWCVGLYNNWHKLFEYF